MMHRVLGLAALVAALGLVPAARAQSPTGGASSRDSARTWIVRVAGVTGAEVCPCASPSLFVPHDRALYIVGVGLRKVLHTDGKDGFEVDYDPQFLPYVASFGTADERLHVVLCNGTHYCATTTSSSPWTTNAYGIGILPIGFTVLAPLLPRVRFQFRGAAGAVRVSEPVPVVQGHKFNFMAEASTTLEVRVTSSLALTGGMVFNHISNGGTAAINPGMNSRMLEFGFVTR